jgi:opacity protein-like surface antigen
MRSLLLAAVLAIVIAPAAQARDATVTSFDGTQIVLSFHPARGGGKAPTILEGAPLVDPARLTLRDVHRADDHVFLHYGLVR